MSDNDDDVVEEVPPAHEEADDNEDDQEYNVEDIRAKRVNPKTKNIEYLIKWENYPETANTWEPAENVMCPDLIIKFNEREQREQKNKRKKRRASNTSSSNESQVETKKTKVSQPTLLLEDEGENSSSNGTDDQVTVVSIPKQPTGFERGTPLQNILGSCVDDGEKLYFFVQFEGAKEMDMVDYEEIVKHAPKQLCDWYKQRQYEAIYQNEREQQKEVPKGAAT